VRARQSYSKEFKDSVVVKILNRGERTIDEVCSEVGVLKTSARNWIKASAMVASKSPQASKGSRMKWTPEAKLKAVFDTANLVDTELGHYLRKEGLYSNQVAEWRSEIIAGLALKPKFKRDERDDQIRVLEREILRKDKALAEASALLILEKKVALIWGKSGEGER
jgi:transposase-like protein